MGTGQPVWARQDVSVEGGPVVIGTEGEVAGFGTEDDAVKVIFGVISCNMKPADLATQVLAPR